MHDRPHVVFRRRRRRNISTGNNNKKERERMSEGGLSRDEVGLITGNESVALYALTDTTDTKWLELDRR